MEKQAKITSKGRITVPLATRRVVGVRAGDVLLFEVDKTTSECVLPNTVGSGTGESAKERKRSFAGRE